MIQPVSTEAVYAALFSLLSQSQVGEQTAFVTASRRLPAIANVLAAQQPAMFFLEGEEDVKENNIGLPVYIYSLAVVVLFKSNASPTTIASTQMNALRDAVVNQLYANTLNASGQVVPMQLGEKQSLGGIVYDVAIVGKIMKNEGLQTQQGGLLFPIKILTGF
jgi:hypothetical protein